jgi:hypothetical protein
LKIAACIPINLNLLASSVSVVNAQSDLDLAILVGGYADPLALWDIAGTISDIIGCDVDLLDLRAASTAMQYQVITTGKRLWNADVQAGLFECFVLSEKAALDMGQHWVRKSHSGVPLPSNAWWLFEILRCMTTKAY